MPGPDGAVSISRRLRLPDATPWPTMTMSPPFIPGIAGMPIVMRTLKLTPGAYGLAPSVATDAATSESANSRRMAARRMVIVELITYSVGVGGQPTCLGHRWFPAELVWQGEQFLVDIALLEVKNLDYLIVILLHPAAVIVVRRDHGS